MGGSEPLAGERDRFLSCRSCCVLLRSQTVSWISTAMGKKASHGTEPPGISLPDGGRSTSMGFEARVHIPALPPFSCGMLSC